MPQPPPATKTETAATAELPLPGQANAEALAEFWLSDRAARGILNEQLALLLRAIVENNPPAHSLTFSYCLICGVALSPEDQPDVWVRGLCCTAGHSWAERGARLHALINDRPFTLHADLSRHVIRAHVSAWLKEPPASASNLHPAVRAVLSGSIFA